MPFIFFGTDIFSVTTLETLKERGFIPSLIITAPSKPQGRKQIITQPPVKVWADRESIPTLQPEKFTRDIALDLIYRGPFDFFVTASYGAIIPEFILDIPVYGAFNIHPSRLPFLRGPSPLQTAILNDMQDTGVSVMKMDSKMDHGDIVAYEGLHKELLPNNWPPTTEELGILLFTRGAHLLADHIPSILDCSLKTTAQDHSIATFTHFINKRDAEVKLTDNPYKNYLKCKAYHKWPRPFFYDENGKRIVITEVEYTDGKLIIKKIIPEGKSEQTYT